MTLSRVLSSSICREGPRHADVLRRARRVRARRLRMEERAVMGNHLPAMVGPRYKGRSTIRARRPSARALSGR